MDSAQQPIMPYAQMQATVPMQEHDLFLHNIQTLYNNVVANHVSAKQALNNVSMVNMYLARDIASLKQENMELKSKTEESPETKEVIEYAPLLESVNATDLLLSVVANDLRVALAKKDAEINGLRTELGVVKRDYEAQLSAKDERMELMKEDVDRFAFSMGEQDKMIDAKSKEVAALTAKTTELEEKLKKATSLHEPSVLLKAQAAALTIKIAELEEKLKKATATDPKLLLKAQADYKNVVDRLSVATGKMAAKDERISELTATLMFRDDQLSQLQTDCKRQADELQKTQEEVITHLLEIEEKTAFCALKEEELVAKDNLLSIRDKELKALKSKPPPPSSAAVVVSQEEPKAVEVYKKDDRDEVIVKLRKFIATLTSVVKDNLTGLTLMVKGNLSEFMAKIAPMEKEMKRMKKTIRILNEKMQKTESGCHKHAETLKLLPKTMTKEMREDIAMLRAFIDSKTKDIDPLAIFPVVTKRLDQHEIGKWVTICANKLAESRKESELVKIENKNMCQAIQLTCSTHTTSFLEILDEKIQEGGAIADEYHRFSLKFRELMKTFKSDMEEKINERLSSYIKISMNKTADV